MILAEALRQCRIRIGVSRQDAVERDGSPGLQVLEQWETGAEMPHLDTLMAYLESLGLDLHHFQDAVEMASGTPPKRITQAIDEIETLRTRIEAMEEYLQRLSAQASPSQSS